MRKSSIRKLPIVPSLTTLKLIQLSPVDYHSKTGALIVGEPDVILPRKTSTVKPIALGEKGSRDDWATARCSTVDWKGCN